MKECLEKVGCKKSLFWKLFLISFLLFSYSYLIIILGYNHIEGYICKIFDMKPAIFASTLALSLAIWKTLIVQFTLVPALVFSWIEYELKKPQQETKEKKSSKKSTETPKDGE